MAKYSIIKAEYDNETGVSNITISSKWGTFSATAKVNEVDWDIRSEFTGLEFAEFKAYIKLLKAKARAYKERANGIYEAVAVLDTKYKQMESFSFTFMQKDSLLMVAKNLEKKSKETYDAVEVLRTFYPDYCKEMLETKRAIAEKYHKD